MPVQEITAPVGVGTRSDTDILAILLGDVDRADEIAEMDVSTGMDVVMSTPACVAFTPLVTASLVTHC